MGLVSVCFTLSIALLIGACRINFSDFGREIWDSLRWYGKNLRGRKSVEDKGWSDEMVGLRRASGP